MSALHSNKTARFRVSLIGKVSPVMRSFQVSSSYELLRTLEESSVPVPTRGQGRKTEHTESWVIRHFLEAAAESGLLEFPLCVEPGDKPDLVLTSQFGKTGIEITEAVLEDSARVDALHAHREISTELMPEDRADVDTYSGSDELGARSVLNDESGAIFIPSYRFGEKRSKKAIEDIARNRDRNQLRPAMGDSWERNWVEAMIGLTKRKAVKFDKYEKHDKNWLLIYDNWTPAPTGGYQMVAIPLARQLFNCEWRNPFEKILILKGDGQSVWEFSREAEIMKLHSPVTVPPD